MKEAGTLKIWKVRMVKNYLEAHNHILVGRLLETTDSYVRLDCISLHFGKNINNLKDVKTGPREKRLLPWSRIELINELPDSFDFAGAKLRMTKNSAIALDDKYYACVIASPYDIKY